jgi:large subunit ribosomal protein L15e
MNEKKFLTAMEPKRRDAVIALKEKDIQAYKETIADLKNVWIERVRVWRHGDVIQKEDKPLKAWRARELGWKDKPGFVSVIARIGKGGRKRRQTSGGRKPAKSYDYTGLDKSKQLLAEERANKKFPNCEVLASYWLWEDGQYKYFEVILVDTHNPHICKDKEINWICEKQQKKRVHRGLTPAGRNMRGQRKKGKGAEKLRGKAAQRY